MNTESYPTPSSKSIVYAAVAALIVYCIAQSEIGWLARNLIIQHIVTILCLASWAGSHKLRKIVSIRKPVGEAERARYRQCYIASILAAVIILSGFGLMFFGNLSSPLAIAITGSLIIGGILVREAADRLYKPFVVDAEPSLA